MFLSANLLNIVLVISIILGVLVLEAGENSAESCAQENRCER